MRVADWFKRAAGPRFIETVPSESMSSAFSERLLLSHSAVVHAHHPIRNAGQIPVDEMTTPYDPMAVAVDWLDAYRKADVDLLLGFYGENAVHECECDGHTVLVGTAAIREYWRQRVKEKPLVNCEIEDLQTDGDDVVLNYRDASSAVCVVFRFNAEGKIGNTECGPAATVTKLTRH
jgi:SnoaL-like protein